MFRLPMADLFGDALLVVDGDLWKRSRTVLSRIFHVTTFKVRQTTDKTSQIRAGLHAELTYPFPYVPDCD
jgi:hypothetical protein